MKLALEYTGVICLIMLFAAVILWLWGASR